MKHGLGGCQSINNTSAARAPLSAAVRGAIILVLHALALVSRTVCSEIMNEGYL